MERIWYIDIRGKEEGPYSESELRRDERITPDTYVWRQGWEQWRRIRDVRELDDLFKEDEPPEEPEDGEAGKEEKPVRIEDELAIDYGEEPPYLFILVVIFILLYLILQLYWK